jgi:hypothetical protein
VVAGISQRISAEVSCLPRWDARRRSTDVLEVCHDQGVVVVVVVVVVYVVVVVVEVVDVVDVDYRDIDGDVDYNYHDSDVDLRSFTIDN